MDLAACGSMYYSTLYYKLSFAVLDCIFSNLIRGLCLWHSRALVLTKHFIFQLMHSVDVQLWFTLHLFFFSTCHQSQIFEFFIPRINSVLFWHVFVFAHRWILSRMQTNWIQSSSQKPHDYIPTKFSIFFFFYTSCSPLSCLVHMQHLEGLQNLY